MSARRTQSLSSIAEREDFLATGDPALREAGETNAFAAQCLTRRLKAIGLT